MSEVNGVEYVCADCGAERCRLYRDYGTFSPKLRCTACATKHQGHGPDGPHSIGWLVAAVPVDGTFWGYTSVPADGVAWWDALPVEPPR